MMDNFRVFGILLLWNETCLEAEILFVEIFWPSQTVNYCHLKFRPERRHPVSGDPAFQTPIDY